ncbi:hypothetical protein [Phorcysia thermohydrogeniphila]|uniref:Lipoprotein n=1 Tax=Phorcysia thermohydrogeniphila TaxID=936138 RepID=A0A4R1GD97_9BACT|nr:hypothetical protein [Phorcysia thermohydrogeniphila]TCK06277.1 hypothetical protein CLV27_0078 [Phorcysia thermohydrogeniphila]
MRSKSLGALLLVGSSLISCATVKTSGELEIRFEKVGNIKGNCPSFVGKEVLLKATYLGWNCPKECKPPAITRSDTCIADETGCIYLLGSGKLNPISDKGRIFLFKGKVELSPYNNTCYIRVEKVDEVK